jgi:hypothetical protein
MHSDPPAASSPDQSGLLVLATEVCWIAGWYLAGERGEVSHRLIGAAEWYLQLRAHHDGGVGDSIFS